MDEATQRTAFLGLVGGFVIYAFSAVAWWVVPDPYRLPVSTGLLLFALAFGVVWVLAVKGGWRVGKSRPRSAKRRKERAKVSPWTRR